MEDNREKKLKGGSVVNLSSPFWNFDKQVAASAAIATCAFQPLEIIRVRRQLGQGSVIPVIENMVTNEGLRSFYRGLSVAVPRQALFTMVGLKSYRAITTRFINEKKKPISRYEHLSCILTAGAFTACICSPAELILTRMQADTSTTSLLGHQRKNAFHTLYQIIKDEGLVTLWKGCTPTVLRTITNTAGIYTATVLFLPFLIHFNPNGVPQRPNKLSREIGINGLIIGGGIIPATLSKPFDYVRTQLQMMKPDGRGKCPYSGPLDCAMKTFKSGGLRKFYVGYRNYTFTCVLHIVVTLAILQQLRLHNIAINLNY